MTDPRPRPKYGEYAPLTPDASAQSTDAADSPHGPTVPAAPQYPAPPAPPQTASAPLSPSQPSPADGTHGAVVPERKRRMWDVVLTAMLLLFGVADVINTFPTVANLGPTLREGLAAQGAGVFTSDDIAAEAGGVANIIRVIVLVLTIVFALMQIQRKRIAFWIPLVGATIAAIALFVAIFVAVLSDPGFMAYVDSLQP